MNPDYSKYTILELEDVLNNIDKMAYPQRYKKAKEQYNQQQNNPKISQSQIEEQAINNKEHKLFYKAAFSFILMIFFLIRTIDALYSGSIRFKTGPLVELAVNPKGFYFILFFHLVFVIFCLCVFYKSVSKRI